jgi:hypothetical protein
MGACHGCTPVRWWAGRCRPRCDATRVPRRVLREEGEIPRRPVLVGETKAGKFERLANLRANQILDGLRKLGSRRCGSEVGPAVRIRFAPPASLQTSVPLETNGRLLVR